MFGPLQDERRTGSKLLPALTARPHWDTRSAADMQARSGRAALPRLASCTKIDPLNAAQKAVFQNPRQETIPPRESQRVNLYTPRHEWKFAEFLRCGTIFKPQCFFLMVHL